MDIKRPNVAPEPAIYLPSVRITPFGAPTWKMVTVPMMKPMIAPTVPPMRAPIFIFSKVEGPAGGPATTGILG